MPSPQDSDPKKTEQMDIDGPAPQMSRKQLEHMERMKRKEEEKAAKGRKKELARIASEKEKEKEREDTVSYLLFLPL